MFQLIKRFFYPNIDNLFLKSPEMNRLLQLENRSSRVSAEIFQGYFS